MSRSLASLRLVVCASVACAGAAGVNVAQATTRRVPTDVASIGGALALSGTLDTVLVAPGTYTEQLTLPTGVTLRADGPKGSVTVDANLFGPCVTAIGTGPATRLEGLRLVRGRGMDEGGATVGGALRVAGGVLLVVECTFEDAQATFGGGTAATLANVTFRDCEWSGTSASFGGGHFQAGGDLRLERARFLQTSAARGGGVHVTGGAHAVIDGALFDRTEASSDGGGAWFDACVATVSEALFDRARADDRGGGLAVAAGGQVLASFLAFVECESGGGGGAFHVSCDPARPQSPGGAAGTLGADCALLSLTNADILLARGASPAAGAVTDAGVVRIRSSIVAGNASGLSCLDPRATLDVTCTDLYENSGPDLSGTCEPASDPNGLTLDPHLCDLVLRDFSLCANSPLLDPGCGDSFWGRSGEGCATCGPTPATDSSWGRLKARYHR
ncbi:MAG: hypothetical protein ACREOU_06400 [Candidatus Eiseniibacteriota bacterium]